MSYRKFLMFIIFLGVESAGAQGAPAPELSVDQYIEQVAQKHDGYKSASESKTAAREYGHEGDLLFSPALFGQFEFDDNKQPGTFLPYSEFLSQTYQLGVSEVTSFGLSGKIYYNVVNSTYDNFMLGGPPVSPSFSQVSPTLQLTLPLWRNWNGSENRATVEQADASAQASYHAQSFQAKTIAQQAEAAYWQLAIARESVRIAQDSVRRNQQLVKWHRERASTGLADRADLLQAEAALQSSLLSFKTSSDNEETAARAFNLARGLNDDDVKERLMPLTPERIANLKVPERIGHREDVLAAEAQQRAARAATEVARQKLRPTLELYGTYATNNATPTDLSNSYATAFETNLPTQAIGVRLNAPLDLQIIRDSKMGHSRDKLAAELLYQRKQLEEESSWSDLNAKFEQARERYVLYQQLEEKQKEKFEYEQVRRRAGRTTTQQVLYFETDYESAQLGRIQTISDILQLWSQMKLFQGDFNGSSSDRD